MWLLGRLLGEHVPVNDEHWVCFLNLLRILTVATAFEVTEDDIAILAMLIEDNLKQFTFLYPDSITPKIHYLLHLPQQILR